MSNLYRLVGEIGYENLIAGTNPPTDVCIRTLRRESVAETTYPMGTILAKSSRDNLLVILGTQVQAP